MRRRRARRCGARSPPASSASVVITAATSWPAGRCSTRGSPTSVRVNRSPTPRRSSRRDSWTRIEIPPPGFGHRFHTRDPRAARLLQLAHELEVDHDYSQLIRALEHALGRHPELAGRSLPVNIDGAIAATCGDLGLVAGDLRRAAHHLARAGPRCACAGRAAPRGADAPHQSDEPLRTTARRSDGCRSVANRRAARRRRPLARRPASAISSIGTPVVGRLAQLVEHRLHTAGVAGSSPAAPTTSNPGCPNKLRESAGPQPSVAEPRFFWWCRCPRDCYRLRRSAPIDSR